MNLEDANWAHFYRKEYGDVGFDPVMFLFNEDDTEERLREGLLVRFGDPKPRFKPPHTADLVNKDGKILMRFYAMSATSAMQTPLPDQ